MRRPRCAFPAHTGCPRNRHWREIGRTCEEKHVTARKPVARATPAGSHSPHGIERDDVYRRAVVCEMSCASRHNLAASFDVLCCACADQITPVRSIHGELRQTGTGVGVARKRKKRKSPGRLKELNFSQL